MGTLQYGLISSIVAMLTGDSLTEQLDSISLSTVVIMFTVFAALVLIILFVILYKLRDINTKPSAVSTSAETVVSQIARPEPSLMDDSELIAVITAAIQASMGSNAPADGFVVRSIRKVR